MTWRDLQSLEALRSVLAEQRRAQRAAAVHASAQERRDHLERNLFAASVGRITPLRAAPLAPVAPPRPVASASQRERDEARVMPEAISDAFDVESLLETDDTLSYRRPGIGPEVVRKLRRGVWAIQAQLDLHGLRRDEAREHLNQFVHRAGRSGLRCVRVIHGKGNGSPDREPVLKARVRGWLAQKNEVIAFTQARAADGGAGALLVLLASSQDVSRSRRSR